MQKTIVMVARSTKDFFESWRFKASAAKKRKRETRATPVVAISQTRLEADSEGVAEGLLWPRRYLRSSLPRACPDVVIDPFSD